MSRFQQPESDLPQPPDVNIDLSKHYDVYCVEMGQRIVVYRNAIIRSLRELLRSGQFDSACQFVMLEQSNGETIFIQRHTVLKLCEPGTEVLAEVVWPK